MDVKSFIALNFLEKTVSESETLKIYKRPEKSDKIIL